MLLIVFIVLTIVLAITTLIMWAISRHLKEKKEDYYERWQKAEAFNNNYQIFVKAVSKAIAGKGSAREDFSYVDEEKLYLSVTFDNIVETFRFIDSINAASAQFQKAAAQCEKGSVTSTVEKVRQHVEAAMELAQKVNKYLQIDASSAIEALPGIKHRGHVSASKQMCEKLAEKLADFIQPFRELEVYLEVTQVSHEEAGIPPDSILEIILAQIKNIPPEKTKEQPSQNNSDEIEEE